ncbi:hypothetical protein ACFFMR_27995 [Micromonospora andamanensis]|nr:hypothetical protein [Micromonospora andamanensis]
MTSTKSLPSRIVRYVNAELLRHDWPRIKRLASRRLVAIWERRLPELVS